MYTRRRKVLTCSFAGEVWRWFDRWTGRGHRRGEDFPSLISAVKEEYKEKKKRKLHMALSYVVLWQIWKSRNEAVFQKKKSHPMRTADEIQLLAFNWIRNRAKCLSLNLHEWCILPSIN
ncbi:hypothetical protein LXL04_018083 [Taraxacum kok-saghyz]